MSWEEDVEARLKLFTDEVRTDVERYLASSRDTDLSDLIWTFIVPFEDAIIGIGVNGYVQVVPIVSRKTQEASNDLDLVTRRIAFMVSKRVTPILLRLSPCPPDVPGDPPPKKHSRGSKEK